jgi:ABC-2 type transport system permease protein
MRPYLAILDSRFRMLLQYRAVALAGVGTQLFFGLIRVMIFDAFYQSSAIPQPLTCAQTTTYIWLGQAMLLMVMFGPESELATMIQSGAVAYEMTRPLDLYTFWFSRCLASRAAPLALRAIPILLIAGLFFHLQLPASFSAAGLFLLSLAIGLLLSAALVTLITLSLLWTVSGQGAASLAPPLIFIASGMIVPLPLLPNWLQPLFDLLPFRGLIDTPFRLYLGNLTGSVAALAIIQQLLWLAILVFLGRFILNRGLRRLVVQGG